MSALTVERERETSRGNGRVAHWSADGKYGLCGAKLLGIPAANLTICDECARLREALYEARRAKR